MTNWGNSYKKIIDVAIILLKKYLNFQEKKVEITVTDDYIGSIVYVPNMVRII
jgi:hypothetical protein